MPEEDQPPPATPNPNLDPPANGDDDHKMKKVKINHKRIRIWIWIHWANFSCGYQQLRSVMLALSGFRRLYSLYLRQLSRLPWSGSNWAPPMIGSKSLTRCGRDEIHLSLPLLLPVYPDPKSPKEVSAYPLQMQKPNTDRDPSQHTAGRRRTTAMTQSKQQKLKKNNQKFQNRDQTKRVAKVDEVDIW